MLPLVELLPATAKPPYVAPEDVALVASWELNASGTTLVSPEGATAGRVVVAPRVRPVLPPAQMLDRLWVASYGSASRKRRLIRTTTVEGEHAILGTTTGAHGAAWLGMVVGDDCVATVEGTGAPEWGERLGRVVRAVTLHLSMGLSERRPRAYRHRPPGAWLPEVGTASETIWRGTATRAWITAYPALPIATGSFAGWLQLRLCGLPLEDWLCSARRAGVTPIVTHRGMSGCLVRGEVSGEDVVVLEEGMYRYVLSMRALPQDDARARRAFIETIESVEPVPRPLEQPRSETLAGDHWAR